MNIYHLHAICGTVDMIVDERSKVSFFDPSREVAMATNFVDKIDLESIHLL